MGKILLQASVALIAVVGFFGHLGCGQERPATQSSPARPPPPSSSSPMAISPQQHWVQSERLKKVMDQLSGLRGAMPKDLPEDAESPAGREARRALAEAAAVADALADTATRIPAAVEGKTMSDADRRGFVAEAGRLHDQAVALRDAARGNRIEPLQGMLDNINSTCISCHSRYRDFSGELNFRKAMAPQFSPAIDLLASGSRGQEAAQNR